jgi:hypothetical protein
MGWNFLEAVPSAIIWAAWMFLAAMFLLVLWNLLKTIDDWGRLFVQKVGDSPHVSRYLLLFGTAILAARFLIAVIKAEDHNTAKTIQDAFRLVSGLDMTSAAGASSVVYLLSKVSNGQILTLFGRRKDS